jgi:hypothetical protein
MLELLKSINMCNMVTVGSFYLIIHRKASADFCFFQTLYFTVVPV